MKPRPILRAGAPERDNRHNFSKGFARGELHSGERPGRRRTDRNFRDVAFVAERPRRRRERHHARGAAAARRRYLALAVPRGTRRRRRRPGRIRHGARRRLNQRERRVRNQPAFGALDRCDAHVPRHRNGERVRRAASARSRIMTRAAAGNASALAAGLVFGLGLAISQMVNPRKVLDFLDVAGNWDPSLALVLGGAVGVAMLALRFVLKRKQPLFESEFHLPRTTKVDRRLLAGSAIFGISWGIGGYCPGPGIAALSAASVEALVFVAGMALGSFLYQRFAAPRG